MPYEVSVPEGCDYVRVMWHEELTGEQMRDSGADALRLVDEHGLSRILIDVSEVRSHPSTIELFTRTVEHARIGSSRPRAALVGRPDQESDMRFVENVGSNRGMPIKSFTNRRKALEWLEG